MSKVKYYSSDHILIALVTIIILFGLVMLSSATSVLGYSKFGDSYWYLKHQILLGCLPGLILFFIFSNINYRNFKKSIFLWFFLSLVLLLSVFMPVIGTNLGTGSRSWIYFFGFSIQPTEIVKLLFIFFLAGWLEKKRNQIRSFSRGFIPFILYVAIVSLLIILQPDIGTLSIFLVIVLAIYFLAGAPWKYLLLIISTALAGLWALIKIAPYRLRRLMVFLHPASDPQGIGYHINQALLAIGSGGWLGLGLGNSRQKFQYLPEVAGDSIFAIVGEELGFVVSFLLVVLFIWLFIRIMKIARQAPDQFGYLLATGIGVWLMGQFFINAGAMLGLMPLTGLPLPLVSYGGSSMMIVMAALGVVVNISKQI